MTSKATNQRDLTDVIKKQKRDGKKAAGIIRAQASGISGADTAITSGQKTSAGGAGGSPVTQDLQMNTFDIRDVDRLYFSTTAGSADVLTANDTGIESKSYYNGTSYVSVGMSQRVPANNVFTFAIGVTERFNIGTLNSALNSNLALGGYLDIGANYIQVDDTTSTLVGTVPANERRMFSDSNNNSELSVKKSDGSVVSLEGGGSGWVGTAASNLNMATFDINMNANIINLDSDSDTYIESQSDDQLKIYSGGNNVMNIKPTVVLVTQPIDMISVPTKYTQGYGIVLDTDEDTKIFASSDDNIQIHTGGSVKLSIGSSATTSSQDLAMSTNDITGIQSLVLDTNSSTPSTNGTIYAQDISGVRRVFVRTGGATKDLTDIGSGGGSSGANTSLSNLTSTGEAHFVKLGNGTAWTAVQHFNQGIDLNDADIDDVGRITFEVNDTSIASTSGGLQYNIPSGDTHIFGVNSGNQLQIGETTTYSGNTFVPSSDGAYALGASNLRWGGVWCDSADIDGAVNITGSVICQGDVNLGNATLDTISLNGGVKIGSGTNNTIGFYGKTPIPQPAVSTSGSLYNVIYALRALGLFG